MFRKKETNFKILQKIKKKKHENLKLGENP
jgi:hypothetical protein